MRKSVRICIAAIAGGVLACGVVCFLLVNGGVRCTPPVEQPVGAGDVLLAKLSDVLGKEGPLLLPTGLDLIENDKLLSRSGSPMVLPRRVTAEWQETPATAYGAEDAARHVYQIKSDWMHHGRVLAAECNRAQFNLDDATVLRLGFRAGLGAPEVPFVAQRHRAGLLIVHLGDGAAEIAVRFSLLGMRRVDGDFFLVRLTAQERKALVAAGSKYTPVGVQSEDLTQEALSAIYRHKMQKAELLQWLAVAPEPYNRRSWTFSAADRSRQVTIRFDETEATSVIEVGGKAAFGGVKSDGRSNKE